MEDICVSFCNSTSVSIFLPELDAVRDFEVLRGSFYINMLRDFFEADVKWSVKVDMFWSEDLIFI